MSVLPTSGNLVAFMPPFSLMRLKIEAPPGDIIRR
jgi:hypothetical protein